MLSKADVVKRYLPDQLTVAAEAEAYAPSNIALCKYWGKRDKALNLPVNSSLSVSLGHLGSHTTLRPIDAPLDQVLLNGQLQAPETPFTKKVSAFLDLFRRDQAQPLLIDTRNTIPTAAGLASSASGFAALTLAVDRLFALELPPAVLSAFARMGSGSASRSVFNGFVEWQMGQQDDGMDSHAVPLGIDWPAFRIGLLKINTGPKAVDSRAGMQRTVETASLYQSWPAQAAKDLETLRSAILNQDFPTLGATAEHNAMSMHATMIASWPPLVYWQPESVAAMQKVWALRAAGVELYFTMDAGPNLKLLFLEQDSALVQTEFPELEIIAPFCKE